MLYFDPIGLIPKRIHNPITCVRYVNLEGHQTHDAEE